MSEDATEAPKALEVPPATDVSPLPRKQRAATAAKTYLFYGLKLWHGVNGALMAGLLAAIASATHSSAVLTPEQAGWASVGGAALAALHKSLGEWVTELREHLATL